MMLACYDKHTDIFLAYGLGRLGEQRSMGMASPRRPRSLTSRWRDLGPIWPRGARSCPSGGGFFPRGSPQGKLPSSLLSSALI